MHKLLSLPYLSSSESMGKFLRKPGSDGDVVIEPNFDKEAGLIPAVVQDHDTGEVLMLAYMNREAWLKTIETGKATYWSRSRRSLWKKGEISGNVQLVREIQLDCDEDAVLLKVTQVGEAACHTGYRSCFYRKLIDGEFITVGERVFDPGEVYK
jgi:phosphoribosyl-AMP cyclohydrolase